MAEGADRNEILQWLVRTLSHQLVQVFNTMVGEAPLVEAEMLALAPLGGDALVWEAAVNLAPSGAIWLHAPRASWQGLGNRVLTAAGLDGSDDQTIEDTFKEAIDQVFSGLAREITSSTGRETTISSGKVTTAALPAKASWNRFELNFGGNQAVLLTFGFIEDLVERLGTKRADTPGAPAKAASITAAASAVGLSKGTHQESRTLDLLLDVELPISVSFGRAHLPLKEVMKLTTGSVVELNRTISEPVDIIVNNCVIARGEVVVVEGNFGVRIQEVVSRQERLRTLY